MTELYALCTLRLASPNLRLSLMTELYVLCALRLQHMVIKVGVWYDWKTYSALSPVDKSLI
jgi:hypothetical protein